MNEALTPLEVSAYRQITGMSQTELARELGVNIRTVRRWESGDQTIGPDNSERMRELVAELVAESLKVHADGYKARDTAETGRRTVRIDRDHRTPAGHICKGWSAALVAYAILAMAMHDVQHTWKGTAS